MLKAIIDYKPRYVLTLFEVPDNKRFELFVQLLGIVTRELFQFQQTK